MATNGSFYSDIYPALYDLLTERAGNTNPHELGNSGVSGLTPFVRLVSGVDDGLILQPTYPNESFETRYGNESSPGIVGINFSGDPVRVSGRGLRPSPIITGLSVEEGKDGFRTCTINMNAYTVEQADLLSSYFLEPGFHILIEWGWNTNEGLSQIVGNGGSTTACEVSLYDRWKTIKKKRENSNYNYDATLGFVGGGGISFADDESYDIQIEVRGIGQVAEYMQIQRTSPSLSNSDSESSQIFSPENIESATSVGKRLFMLMVNDLPSDKQIPQVVNLFGFPKWTDVANYVNMDTEVVEDFHERLSESATLFSRENDSVEIPTDIPLLSKDRFIRLELAFEILNSYSVNLEPVVVDGCEKRSRGKRISIDDTVITAFPHMFSTDKSKLFIPNTMAPDFKFVESLSQISNIDKAKEFIVFDNLKDESNLQNLHPSTEGSEYTNLTDAQSAQKDGQSRYAFPATYPLSSNWKPVNNTDETFIPPTAPAYFWGWLKDLYINFDFFCDVISKPNFFIRDVVYELLNGLSSACSSIWNFQIVEGTTEDENGDLMLKVIDANFRGEINFSDDSIQTFQARGVSSPFIDIGFDVSMEGDLMSSIIQSRMDGGTLGNVEGRDAHHYKASVFTDGKVDKVGKILQNYSQEVGNDSEDNNEITITPANNKPVDALEKRKQIYQILTQKGGVFLKTQDRETAGDLDVKKQFWDVFNTKNNTAIEDILFLGTWDDPLALKLVYFIDNGLHSEIPGFMERSALEALNFNVPFGGMGEISFTVIGVSGFKPSDRFRVKGLPVKFSSGIFQITDISHEISEDGWTTSVKATFVPEPMNKQGVVNE